MSILSFLFPPRCILCKAIAGAADRYICPHCLEKLPQGSRGYIHTAGMYCDGIFSATYYRGAMREAIKRFKYHNMAFYKIPFGALLFSVYQKAHLPAFDYITYVPAFFTRLYRRGYNQSGLLAAQLGAHMGTPGAVKGLLIKTRATKKQAKLSLTERRDNLQNCFVVKGGLPLEGKCICLVDDVSTTGFTLEECAKVLKAHGAAKVYSLTVAKTNSERGKTA